MNARPRALPPSDPPPMRQKLAAGSKLVASKSATIRAAALLAVSLNRVDEVLRRSSMVAKSDTFRGRSRCASANSVRAFSHLEK